MNDDFQIQQQLLSELDSGEKIIWQGKPKIRMSPAGAFPFLFIGIWILGFSGIFLKASHGSARVNPPTPFFLIFPVFVLIFVVATPVMRFFALSRTHYLLTNRRALIVTLGSNRKVASYYPDKLQTLERRERKDGWGDLILDKSSPSAGYGYRASNIAQPVGFMNIPDVKNVETLMRGLINAANK